LSIPPFPTRRSSDLVVLAAVGLFGAMATMVRQRTRELGVRMALGATAPDLRRMVMGRGLAIAAAGSALGLVGVLLANRLLSALLYEVAPTDLVTLAAVTGFLVGVAALARLVPAPSSTRLAAVIALRAEGQRSMQGCAGARRARPASLHQSSGPRAPPLSGTLE